jgi:hypothetical protein
MGVGVDKHLSFMNINNIDNKKRKNVELVGLFILVDSDRLCGTTGTLLIGILRRRRKIKKYVGRTSDVLGIYPAHNLNAFNQAHTQQSRRSIKRIFPTFVLF